MAEAAVSYVLGEIEFVKNYSFMKLFSMINKMLKSDLHTQAFLEHKY